MMMRPCDRRVAPTSKALHHIHHEGLTTLSGHHRHDKGHVNLETRGYTHRREAKTNKTKPVRCSKISDTNK